MKDTNLTEQQILKSETLYHPNGERRLRRIVYGSGYWEEWQFDKNGRCLMYHDANNTIQKYSYKNAIKETP